ncbi:MAG: hypothetical protein IJP86_03920 [Synergistaceae bacterium]|nr:hypothetical protein [Synergistaceae bacterium]
MTVKEKYEAPSAEIISFTDADIITASETRMPAITGSGAPSVSSFY